MCLLVVLSGTEEDAPLLIGANRDEKLDRPAVAATVLSASDPRILGGRDLLAGGTWLAVNEHGVVAGLTNRPSPGGRDASKRTRGELPLALAADDRAEAAVEEFVRRFRPADYNAAWLLVGDRRSLYYLELGEDAAPGVEVLAPGVHVLANGPLHQSSPKTDHVHAEVDGLAGRGTRAVLEALPRVLADHRVPEAVRDAPPVADRPKELAAPCVHTEQFGTRSAAIVVVPAEGRPSLRVADGPPCVAPFVAVDHLWEADTPASQAAGG